MDQHARAAEAQQQVMEAERKEQEVGAYAMSLAEERLSGAFPELRANKALRRESAKRFLANNTEESAEIYREAREAVGRARARRRSL